MSRKLEPLLDPVDIDHLRPTQLTVGYREVERKRAKWRAQVDDKGPEFLGRHMIPVAIGPDRRPHIIDHHHLVRALSEEGVTQVLVDIVADLSGIDPSLFETFMDNRNWLHPFDAQGVRQRYDSLPKHIGDLADDPYRSLAGALRRAGGYAKVPTPYSEFLWADFLRRRIDRRQVDDHFDAALAAALTAARSADASYLPGWAGPDDD